MGDFGRSYIISIAKPIFPEREETKAETIERGTGGPSP
jgi:hypothetical protein